MKKSNLLVLSIMASGCAAGSGQQAVKPNIVFILADDMGYGDVSYLSADAKLKTENLDRMAQNGVVFTDAHSSSSVSTPTRYGILTGRYNWRSTLKQGVLYGYSKALIKPDRETMASMLRKNGYYTGGIGKWHLGWDWAGIDGGIDNVDFSKPVSNGPTTRGFDYWYGFCGSLDMAPYVYIENDMPTAIPTETTESKAEYGWWRKGLTAPDFKHIDVVPNITRRACSFIAEKSKSDDPYFLYLPYPAPHTPILPTEEFRGKSGLGEYGDYVMMLDAMVGRVLDAVKASGEGDNTIVVFTTDNGCSPAAGIEEMKKLGHSANDIYRGHKADLFDGGHRIPCILQWPAKVKHHEVNQTICLTDFYATFAAAAGYELMDNEGEDSYNLMPALLSEEEVAPIREATVHHSIYGEFTIRKGDWKLLLSPSSGGWSYPSPKEKADHEIIACLPVMQLYNMKEDPSETTNVVAEYPDIVKELKDLMIKYIDDGRSTPGKPQKNDFVKEWPQVQNVKEL